VNPRCRPRFAAHQGKKWDVIAHPCPWCHQGRGKPCKTLSGKLANKNHLSRHAAFVRFNRIEQDVIAHEPCPQCHQGRGKSCKTPSGKFAKENHLSRHDAFVRFNSAYQASDYAV
jgi:hypothetical protein